MTQELIANMLGVRREGVTEAAGKLQAAGVIRYSRSRITVLDCAALEAHACECYGVVKQESDRLLPRLDARQSYSPIETGSRTVSSRYDDGRYTRSRRISFSFFAFRAAAGKSTSTTWVASWPGSSRSAAP